jgi:predicted site-specific integrase-resolvase
MNGIPLMKSLEGLCSKILIPQKANPICCPVQTLSVSEIGREINRLKKTIKAQKDSSEQREDHKEQILQVEHQKYHVLIDLKIQGIPFKLKTLIDTGSDLNMLHKGHYSCIFMAKDSSLSCWIGKYPK